jgi:hypothetical protein
MNNLYHKVAVASVCTALGFALGANKEAKAATFTLTPTILSLASQIRIGRSGRQLFPGGAPFHVGIINVKGNSKKQSFLRI